MSICIIRVVAKSGTLAVLEGGARVVKLNRSGQATVLSLDQFTDLVT